MAERAKKYDIFIVAVILLFAVIMIFLNLIIPQKGITGVKVTVDGVLAVSTTQEGLYPIEKDGKYLLTVEFYQGKVRVKESTCDNQICVRTGWISNTGQTIVCLPYKIVVEPIGGTKTDGVDIITW
ncbi:MAG TPA: NusG domain II-containing protein [Petrotogaceae bacterium]|nr:NusG domain II-containing protein [Petrotogaceae bacterium]